MYSLNKFQINFLHLQNENLKWYLLTNNFFVGNLQLPAGKLQLSAPNFFNPTMPLTPVGSTDICMDNIW